MSIHITNGNSGGSEIPVTSINDATPADWSRIRKELKAEGRTPLAQFPAQVFEIYAGGAVKAEALASARMDETGSYVGLDIVYRDSATHGDARQDSLGRRFLNAAQNQAAPLGIQRIGYHAPDGAVSFYGPGG